MSIYQSITSGIPESEEDREKMVKGSSIYERITSEKPEIKEVIPPKKPTIKEKAVGILGKARTFVKESVFKKKEEEKVAPPKRNRALDFLVGVGSGGVMLPEPGREDTFAKDILVGGAGIVSGAIDATTRLFEGIERRQREEIETIADPKKKEIATKVAFPGGKKLSDLSRTASKKIKSWSAELYPEDPDLADKLMQGIGSMGAFAATTIVSGGGTLIPVVLESVVEMGSVYEENREAGLSVEEAGKRADIAFGLNLVLNKLLNVFDIPSEDIGIISKAAKGAGFEGVQEGSQQIISNVYTDRPPLEGVLESMGIGAMLGGGTAVVLPSGDGSAKQYDRREEETAIDPDVVKKQVREVIEEEKPAEAPKQETTSTLGKETIVYRGAKDQTIDVSRENGITGGVSLSEDLAVAQRFAKRAGGTVAAYRISPDAKVINHSLLEGLSKDEINKFLQYNKIDVVRFDVPEGARGEAELRVLNKNVLEKVSEVPPTEKPPLETIPKEREEGVKTPTGAKILYHGTTPENAKIIKEKGFEIKPPVHGQQVIGEGVYLTPTREEAATFGKEIVEAIVKPGAKILKLKNPSEYSDLWQKVAKEVGAFGVEDVNMDKAISDYLKARGYDGIEVKGFGTKGETYISIFDPKNIEIKEETTKRTKEAKKREAFELKSDTPEYRAISLWINKNDPTELNRLITKPTDNFKKILKKTQDILRSKYGDEITLYRGITEEEEIEGKGMFTSYTSDKDIAQKFSAEEFEIFTETIPVENILLGPESTSLLDDEKEYIVKRITIEPEEKVAIAKEITQLQEKVIEDKIKTTKDIKGVRDTLRTIRQNLDEAITEAEGRAIVAQEQRAGLNIEDINQLKRVYYLNRKFQEGDIETIRRSKSGPLLNRVLENIQEKYPYFSEQEAFDFALELPTQADERIRTSEIIELEKKEKKLRKYLDQLRAKQKELNIQETELLTKEWESALAAQEKLIQIIRVPETQLPVGEGPERVSRLEARVKDALGRFAPYEQEALGLSTYRQMNKADQIAKASKYVSENTNEALKVLKGEIDPPTGILRNSIYVALKELGSADTQVATQIASLASTRLGQEISILSEIDADSPVSLMEDVVRARIEGFKRRGKDVKQAIKKESDKIKIDKPSMSDWDAFLASIRC